MALSWDEIRDQSLAFSKEWAGETPESAEAERVAFLFDRYLQLVEPLVAGEPKHRKRSENAS